LLWLQQRLWDHVHGGRVGNVFCYNERQPHSDKIPAAKLLDGIYGDSLRDEQVSVRSASDGFEKAVQGISVLPHEL
jgi:hypothetical protein